MRSARARGFPRRGGWREPRRRRRPRRARRRARRAHRRRVGDARQQRGRHDPAARRDRRPSCASARRARRCTPTRCRRVPWLDVAEADARAPISSRSRPTSSAGRRAPVRSSCAARSRSSRCSRAGARSAGCARAPSTSPGRSRWRPRLDGDRHATRAVDVARIAGLRDRLLDGPARDRRRRCSRTATGAQGRGQLPRRVAGRRGGSAARRRSTAPACTPPPDRRARRARPSRRTCSRPWGCRAMRRSPRSA